MSPAVVTGLLFMMVLMFKTDSVDGQGTNELRAMCREKYPPQYCNYKWERLDSGRCMRLASTRADFDTSKMFCGREGGTLVSIRSERDYYKVLCMMVNKYYDVTPYWIGGRIQNGVFQWVDGSGPVTFQKWGPGQPDFYQQREHCLEMNAGKWGDWNDLSCSESRVFVCQKSG